MGTAFSFERSKREPAFVLMRVIRAGIRGFSHEQLCAKCDYWRAVSAQKSAGLLTI